MPRKPRTDGRTQKGQFAPGTSGNPTGLPQKARVDRGDPNTVPKAERIRTDGWSNFFTGHGVYGQDKRMGGSFQTDILSFDMMQQLARGDDLAKRAGEILPKEAFRQGWDLVIPEEEGDEDEDDRVQQILDKLDVLGAKPYLKQALCYERFYGGAAILLGVNDGQPDLSKPLNLDKVKSLDYLTPMEARELMPVYGYADPRAPKYGQPEIYRLVTRAVLPSHDGKYHPVTVDIHESRLLIFPGSRVSRYQITSMQGGWGDSILTPMYRVLRDFNMTWASAGVLVTDFARGVYKFENLWETLAGDDADAFQMRLQAMELSASTINATVIDKNDDFIRQVASLTGLPDLLDKFAIRLAAAADMPVTLLFGTSPAGMNATGESDIRFFYDRVAEYQEERVMPQLKRLIQIVMRVTGVKQEPKKWSIKFRPLWQESAKDKASAMLTQAQADAAWIGAGVFSAEECASAHWESGEYNPNITIDFEAREKQEQAVKAPIQQKDLNALDPDHPDYKGSSLDPNGNNYVEPPVDPDTAVANVAAGLGMQKVPKKPGGGGGGFGFGAKTGPGIKKGAQKKDDAYAGARAWRKKFHPDAFPSAGGGGGGSGIPPKPPTPPAPGASPSGGGAPPSGQEPAPAAPAAQKKKRTLPPGPDVNTGGDYDPPPDDPDEPDPNTPPQNPIEQADAVDDRSLTFEKTQTEDPARGPNNWTGTSKFNGEVVKRKPLPNKKSAAARPADGLHSDAFDPDQTRGENGRWASEGEGVSERLAIDSKANGGMTYDPRSGVHPAEGYSVAIYKERERKIPGAAPLNPDDIKNYIKDNHDVLLRDSKAQIGTWYNDKNDTWYLDVPHVEKSLDTAVKLGQNHGQLAIFDLKRFEEIHDHEYKDALGRKGRFSRHDEAGWSTASALRPTNDNAGTDGRGDEQVSRGDSKGEGSAGGLNREDYAPDQARDERGRFGAGGGGGGGKAPRNPTVQIPKPDPMGHHKDPRRAAENAYWEQFAANQGKPLSMEQGEYEKRQRVAEVVARQVAAASAIREGNSPSEAERLLRPAVPSAQERLPVDNNAFRGPAALKAAQEERAAQMREIAETVAGKEPQSLAEKMLGTSVAKRFFPASNPESSDAHERFGYPEQESRPGPGPSLKLNTETPQNPTVERFATAAGREELAKHEIAFVKPNDDSGANASFKVRLDDGSKALWKPSSGEQGGLRHGIIKGTYAAREAAFSKVAGNLGVADLAPAAVEHVHVDKSGETSGALQSWVTGTPAQYSDDVINRADAERMRVADYVTGNTDRHGGNMLIAADGDKPVLIDHGLTFSSSLKDRFIQPWDNIPHERGPLLPSTISQIQKIDIPRMARDLKESGIERDAIRLSVLRASRLKASPAILEIPKNGNSNPKGAEYTWQNMAQMDLEESHGGEADAIMKDI